MKAVFFNERFDILEEVSGLRGAIVYNSTQPSTPCFMLEEVTGDYFYSKDEFIESLSCTADRLLIAYMFNESRKDWSFCWIPVQDGVVWDLVKHFLKGSTFWIDTSITQKQRKFVYNMGIEIQ